MLASAAPFRAQSDETGPCGDIRDFAPKPAVCRPSNSAKGTKKRRKRTQAGANRSTARKCPVGAGQSRGGGKHRRNPLLPVKVLTFTRKKPPFFTHKNVRKTRVVDNSLCIVHKIFQHRILKRGIPLHVVSSFCTMAILHLFSLIWCRMLPASVLSDPHAESDPDSLKITPKRPKGEKREKTPHFPSISSIWQTPQKPRKHRDFHENIPKM